MSTEATTTTTTTTETGAKEGSTILTEPTKMQADPAPASSQADPSLPEWLAGLPDDLKGEPSLKNFKDVASLAKSLVHAQKMVGADKIAVPNPKTATDEDYLKVFQKLGLPETLDKYDLGKIEGADEKLLQGFREAAHKAGILPSQAKKILDYYQASSQQSIQAAQARVEAELQSGVESLKKEWGQGFDKEVLAAKVALKEFGDENLTKYLHESGLGSNPHLIKLLNRVGKALKEDEVLGASAGRDFGMTPSEAQAEINKIMADPVYWNPSHPQRKDLVERALKLREALVSGTV